MLTFTFSQCLHTYILSINIKKYNHQLKFFLYFFYYLYEFSYFFWKRHLWPWSKKFSKKKRRRNTNFNKFHFLPETVLEKYSSFQGESSTWFINIITLDFNPLIILFFYSYLLHKLQNTTLFLLFFTFTHSLSSIFYPIILKLLHVIKIHIN